MKHDVASRIASARRRLYRQPGGLIRWLADFSRMDLSPRQLRNGELRDLGDDVLAFSEADEYDFGGSTAMPQTLEQPEIVQLQKVALEVLEDLATLGVWLPHQALADLPLTPGLSIDYQDPRIPDNFPARRRPVVSSRGSLQLPPIKTAYKFPEQPSLLQLFLLQTLRQLDRASVALYRCAWCARFFYRLRRQKYCSKSCTQAAMNARQPGRRKTSPLIEMERQIARSKTR